MVNLHHDGGKGKYAFMRLFKPKTLPGWFFAILGPCWQFIRNCAAADFVFRKLGLEKQMTARLGAIASSTWFPFALLIVGILWICWTTRLNPKIKQKRVRLKELINELTTLAEHKYPGYNWDNIRFARTQLFEWKDKAKRLLFNLFGQVELNNFDNKIKYVENKNEYQNSNIGGIAAFYNEAEIYLKYLSDLLDSLEKHPELY